MRILRYLAVLVCAAPLFGAYTYSIWTESWGSTISGNWTQNGTISASGGLTSASATGGSLISNVAIPDGTSQYEVKTKIALAQSGGTYISYLRATSNAISSSSAAGTFYSVELQNPTFSGSSCSAYLILYKVVSGVYTGLTATNVPCHNGVEIRAVYATSGQIIVYVDNLWYLYAIDTSITAGQPGVGVRGAPAGMESWDQQTQGLQSHARTGNGLMLCSEAGELWWPIPACGQSKPPPFNGSNRLTALKRRGIIQVHSRSKPLCVYYGSEIHLTGEAYQALTEFYA